MFTLQILYINVEEVRIADARKTEKKRQQIKAENVNDFF